MTHDSGEVTSEELERCLMDGLLPEMPPTRQGRSLRNAAAMLSSGLELLEHRSLEDLSVESVCELAGTTVGAFYSRFASKDAFFLTLQRICLLRSERKLEVIRERHEAGDGDMESMVRDIVELMVESYRGDHGMLRASLQHTREGMWRLVRASGDRYRQLLAETVAHSVAGTRQEARMRAQFAYQAVIGVLVHATLNNPGPLGLEHPALVPELVRLVRGYLWGEASGSVQRAAVRKRSSA